MNLRATRHGYAYQDLITGIALVDLMLGTAETITVDTKGFTGDRFDDLTIAYRTGRRVRIQIEHTSRDRELSKDSFSADGRSLRLDLLFRALLSDLDQYPGSMYRVLVRDGSPDDGLAAVLKLMYPATILATLCQASPLAGSSSIRRPSRRPAPGKNSSPISADARVRTACEHLTIDTSAPASSLDFTSPGPAERALLRRASVVRSAQAVLRPPPTPTRPAPTSRLITHRLLSLLRRLRACTRRSSGQTRPPPHHRGEAAGVRRGPPAVVPGVRRDRLAGLAPRRSCPGRQPDRVGDGPVHRRGLAEFLMSQVAHGDYQVAVLPDLADVAGPQPGQRQAVARGGGDGAGSIAWPVVFRPIQPGGCWPGATVRRPGASGRSWRCRRTAPAARRGLAAGRASPGRRGSAGGRCGGGRLQTGGG